MNKSRLIKLLLIISVLFMLIYAGARYGWKVFGFKQCQNPDILYVANVTVANGEVNVSGHTTASAGAFDGYTYDLKDDKLYLGLKYDLFFGHSGDFDISVKTDTAKVNQVFLKSESGQKEIWNRKALDVNSNAKYKEIISTEGEIDLGAAEELGDEYKESLRDAEARLPKLHLLYGDTEIKWMIGDSNYTGKVGGIIGNTSFGWRFRDVYLSEGAKVKPGSELKFRADDVKGFDKPKLTVILHTDAQHSSYYDATSNTIKLAENPGIYILEFTSDWGKGDNNVAYWCKVVVEK